MELKPESPPRLIKLPEVLGRCAISKTAAYDAMKGGSFPRPVPLTRTARAWLESDVIAWIAERVAERDEGRAA